MASVIVVIDKSTAKTNTTMRRRRTNRHDDFMQGRLIYENMIYDCSNSLLKFKAHINISSKIQPTTAN